MWFQSTRQKKTTSGTRNWSEVVQWPEGIPAEDQVAVAGSALLVEHTGRITGLRGLVLVLGRADLLHHVVHELDGRWPVFRVRGNESTALDRRFDCSYRLEQVLERRISAREAAQSVRIGRLSIARGAHDLGFVVETKNAAEPGAVDIGEVVDAADAFQRVLIRVSGANRK